MQVEHLSHWAIRSGFEWFVEQKHLALWNLNCHWSCHGYKSLIMNCSTPKWWANSLCEAETLQALGSFDTVYYVTSRFKIKSSLLKMCHLHLYNLDDLLDRTSRLIGIHWVVVCQAKFLLCGRSHNKNVTIVLLDSVLCLQTCIDDQIQTNPRYYDPIHSLRSIKGVEMEELKSTLPGSGIHNAINISYS